MGFPRVATSPSKRSSSARSTLTLLGLLALAGCDDDPRSTLSFAVPTEVAVDPGDFLGNVSCSTQEGAMRSYVMTLSAFEDEEDTTPFTIGSTQPTPCALVAGFREVIVVGQPHIAAVDGYDIAPELLVPFGGISSGSRQMRHAETGEPVEPRWTTRCGTSAETGAVATVSRRVFVRPCEPLEDASPTPTQIALGPTDVLGKEACDVAATFDVTPETGNLPATADVACDAEPLTFVVAPDTSYELYATATIDDTLHGAICTARAVLGVTVAVRCNPLSPRGHARLFLGDVLASSEDPLCPDGAFFDVVDGETVLNGVPLPCESAAQVGPLAAGLKLLDVIISDGVGNQMATGSCGVEIEPGKTTNALCLPD